VTLVLRRNLRPCAVAPAMPAPGVPAGPDGMVYIHGRNYERVLWTHVPVKSIIVFGEEGDYAMLVKQNRFTAKSINGTRRYPGPLSYVYRRVHNG
jgi:hypothetical protein